ncbi:pentatricopeptide (PPR) repeat-containing protein [Wolffia australiana]
MALNYAVGSLSFIRSCSSPSSRYGSIILSRNRVSFGSLRLKAPKSVELDRVLTSDSVDELGEVFFEAVEELERMARDPSDVLGDFVERLSARELQLVLLYFSQEGRDAYCALEVFDWMRKENRVDAETMELMVSIACGWIDRLVGEEHQVEDLVGLLKEIDCVGLEPGFSMVEKVISSYWDRGKEEEAVSFVKNVLRRGGIGSTDAGSELKDHRGLVGYLAWKMMADGKFRSAVKLVMECRDCGLKPEAYSYIVALTALVKEQKEFSKSLRRLRGFIKAGTMAELDDESRCHIEQYQADLLRQGASLSSWAIEEGGPDVSAVVHERLLILYTCASNGRQAEEQLWQMRLAGRQPDAELCNIILALCAAQNEESAVRRLLAGAEAAAAGPRKRTLLWLLRGYLKGGYYIKAAETLLDMVNAGMSPGYVDCAGVLQGLRMAMQDSASVDRYLKLCKRLSDVGLIGPCIVYLRVGGKYKLWIMKMV